MIPSHSAARAGSAAPVSPRRIWLCADDYGISPGVSAAIRDLIARGRINATSVMVLAPSFDRGQAAALDEAARAQRAALGLHVTLTAPFRPLTRAFRPLQTEAFLPLDRMLLRGALRLLDADALKREIAAQIEAFTAAFGRPPDFADGHQHVQLFPQVREAFLAAVKERAPGAWVRQCGSAASLRARLPDRKGLLLQALSRAFRRRAAAHGVATNPAFAGTYDFAAAPVREFAELFAGFLDRLPGGGVVMCHPGKVDAELERLDPLTVQRELEYEFLSGAAFPDLLRACRVTLA